MWRVWVRALSYCCGGGWQGRTGQERLGEGRAVRKRSPTVPHLRLPSHEGDNLMPSHGQINEWSSTWNLDPHLTILETC